MMIHPQNWIKLPKNTSPRSPAEAVNISVREPVSFSPNPLVTYTSFAIYIETSHPAFSAARSASRRRYSEFRWLRRVLARHHPQRRPPNLPPSGMLVWNKYDDAFLESRRSGLQTFLREVVCVPAYLGERALHLFLQTELPVRDIEANLQGLRDDSVAQLCSYWPATPKSHEEEEEIVTSPRDIVTPVAGSGQVMTCSVTSDASSSDDQLCWSPPCRSPGWLPPPTSHGLSSSLIC